MFSHLMVGSNDIERAKRFYDALFAVLGGKPGQTDPKGRLIYAHNGGRFMVSKPIDGGEASGANGGTVGFKLDSAEEIQSWHKAGLEAGGTAIEDPPGPRSGANGAVYHAAYLRDPDGNKLCGIFRPAS